MACAICGRTPRELKNDLCFRCFVISRAIRLEPDLPQTNNPIEIKPPDDFKKHSAFILKPFVTDLQLDKHE